MNGAEYLLQFFNVEKREEDFNDSAAVAFTAMCATQEIVERMRGLEIQRLDTVLDQLPMVWERLMRSFGTALSGNTYRDFSPSLNHVEELPPSSVLALQNIADKWYMFEPTFNEKKKENISDFLTAVVNLMKEDQSIPNALKMYVLSLVQHVRSILERNAAGCDVELDKVLKELLASLSFAESKSTNGSKWEQFKEQCLFPFTSALFANVVTSLVEATPFIAGLLGN